MAAITPMDKWAWYFSSGTSVDVGTSIADQLHPGAAMAAVTTDARGQSMSRDQALGDDFHPHQLFDTCVDGQCFAAPRHDPDNPTLQQALNGLEQDPADDQQQTEPVDERRQDLETLVTVGQVAARRALADMERGSSERQRHRVSQHVAGVGQQRQRPGQDAADDLDDHESARQDERDQYTLQVPGIGLVHMRVSVVVIVTMVM